MTPQTLLNSDNRKTNSNFSDPINFNDSTNFMLLPGHVVCRYKRWQNITWFLVIERIKICRKGNYFSKMAKTSSWLVHIYAVLSDEHDRNSRDKKHIDFTQFHISGWKFFVQKLGPRNNQRYISCKFWNRPFICFAK
jgi:hypothetical protein